MGFLRNRSPSNDEQIDFPDYGPVVDLVRRLGDRATATFLDELSPQLDGVQKREKDASERLNIFLHSWAVSAVVMLEAGGLDQFDQIVEREPPGSVKVKSAQEVLTDVNGLT